LAAKRLLLIKHVHTEKTVKNTGKELEQSHCKKVPVRLGQVLEVDLVLLIAVALGRSEPVKNLNKNDIFLDDEINQSFSRIMG
jgi:hypothetical protein